NARPGCSSASSPLVAKGWCSAIGRAPVKSWSARSRRSVAMGGASHLPSLPRKSKRVPIPPVTIAEPTPSEEGALARSQAARRRRVLDAALRLAAEGGFDGVQMRDVAAAADVALGTVYRYFSSKERLL